MIMHILCVLFEGVRKQFVPVNLFNFVEVMNVSERALPS